MSDKTDHAEEAVRLTGITVNGDDSTLVMLQVIANTIGAQAHATLALVEQQRIANLIAYASAHGNSPSIYPEVKKGLGL